MLFRSGTTSSQLHPQKQRALQLGSALLLRARGQFRNSLLPRGLFGAIPRQPIPAVRLYRRVQQNGRLSPPKSSLAMICMGSRLVSRDSEGRRISGGWRDSRFLRLIRQRSPRPQSMSALPWNSQPTTGAHEIHLRLLLVSEGPHWIDASRTQGRKNGCSAGDEGERRNREHKYRWIPWRCFIEKAREGAGSQHSSN